jgi:hypothetical protein
MNLLLVPPAALSQIVFTICSRDFSRHYVHSIFLIYSSQGIKINTNIILILMKTEIKREGK